MNVCVCEPCVECLLWESLFLGRTWVHDYRWHCTKSSDCQVRVNVTKVVIGPYM